MAEWKFELGGSSGLIIDKTTDQGHEVNWMPVIERVTNAKGETEGHRWTFEFEGNVIDAASGLPATVATGFLNLTKEITEQGSRSFEAFLDGSSFLSVDPTECFWGPFVESVRPVNDEGNADGHWRYAMTIKAFVKQGNGYDIDTSLQIDKNPQGKVVQKIWRVHAKAKTVEAAVDVVNGFRPGGVEVYESIIRRAKRAEADGIWTWKSTRPGKILLWNCEVSITPAGPDFLIDKQAGKDVPPVLHEVRADVAIVVVKGRIESMDPKVGPPPAHFAEGANIKRVPRREAGTMTEAAVLSDADGTYYLVYIEVYLIKGVVPAANHAGNHNLVVLASPPGNGAMGS